MLEDFGGDILSNRRSILYETVARLPFDCRRGSLFCIVSFTCRRATPFCLLTLDV